MIFTSFEFIAFFFLVVLGRALCRSHAAENRLLLVASYLFYMSWNIACGGLILFTSTVDYYVGCRLGQINQAAKRKMLLTASLVANLGVLAFFKYTGFLVANTVWIMNELGWHVSRPHLEIILPAGISFFTFQSMSYTIDVYRRKLEPCRNFRDFLLYVAFFPQLLAGPIVRATDLIPQIGRRLRATAAEVESGLTLFALGAVKKMVVSDQIAPHLDPVFANPGAFDGLSLCLALAGYAVQIYCDFSGYSDMAIGCARILGFHFPDNFAMPYSAVTITEFWHRWHMSFSTWLRDYLYIPLGGNRKGEVRTYVNLLATMLLGGLWHGANWTFVLWGLIHGVALATHKAWQAYNPWRNTPIHGVLAFGLGWLSRGLTLGVVLVGWIFFRCQDFTSAWKFLSRIVAWKSDGIRLLSPNVLVAVAAVVLTHLLVSKDAKWSIALPARSFGFRVAVYTALLLAIVLLGATDSAPFIYFQF